MAPVLTRACGMVRHCEDSDHAEHNCVRRDSGGQLAVEGQCAVQSTGPLEHSGENDLESGG